jgi:uncharacterized OB-fold protein
MSGEALLARECPNGHLTYPEHARCPDCGEEQIGTVDLSERDGEVLTWTTVGASPTGVREPNTLAIVEFTIDDRAVRVIGGTTADVSVGQRVRPVFIEELREPDAGIRHRDSQRWHGYRFEPAE